LATVDLVDLIDSVYPTDAATGIPLRTSITVIFSTEMDEPSIEDNFFVEGPNQENWSGPDLMLWSRPSAFSSDTESLNLFRSMSEGGLVAGTISFSRVNISDPSAYSGFDYSGAGNSFRTKMTFAPTNPYVSRTTYYPRLVGMDEGGNIGIRKRSVFDTRKTAGVGSATCTFGGSYTGSVATDVYMAQIEVLGAVGTATYKWWRASNPSVQYGPFITGISQKILVDGVTISFGSTGTFAVGDQFSVVVKVPDEAEGLVKWSFETGSGSIQTLPTAASTSVIGSPILSSGVDATFAVLETDPANRDFNLDVTRINPISVTFTKILDPTSVTLDRVKVVAEPVTDDPVIGLPDYASDLPKRLSVSGRTLTIYI